MIIIIMENPEQKSEVCKTTASIRLQSGGFIKLSILEKSYEFKIFRV